jgi:hypothetical protein
MSTNIEKFVQIGTVQGNVIFASKRLIEWRADFGYIDNWRVGTPFSDAARRLLAALNPPFIPEDEALIFDPDIDSRWVAPEISVRRVEHRGTSLTEGFFFATESRLIFGYTKKSVAFQISYKDIKAVYNQRSTFTIVATDNSQTLIYLKVPGPSPLAIFAVLSGGGAGVVAIERGKVERANKFLGLFRAFFDEIVDENQRRRKGG